MDDTVPIGLMLGPPVHESEDERMEVGLPHGSAGWGDSLSDDIAFPFAQRDGAANYGESSAEKPFTAQSRRRLTKVLPWLIVAVVVIVIVTVIRLSVPGPEAGSLSPTTVAPKGSAATIPVSSAVRSEFTAASKSLETSNLALSRALASPTGQSVAQITQDVAPYVTALNGFSSKMRSVSWSEPLQVPSEGLILRTQELVTFLASISSVNSATQDSWFTQLHALATTAQSADNLLRKDIGLSLTSSYPT